MVNGLFIVIEGVDGAGCGTHSLNVRKWLKQKKKKFLALKYPDYSNSIGKAIHSFLHGKKKFSQDVLFLLFALNQIKDKRKIEQALKTGKIVIADRYFTSNLAYQTNGTPLKSALKFAKTFNIPKPDLIIYLNVKPTTALARKKKEPKHALDIYERDLKRIKTAAKKYKELARKNIFGKWVSVNAEGTIPQVRDRIIKVLQRYIMG